MVGDKPGDRIINLLNSKSFLEEIETLPRLFFVYFLIRVVQERIKLLNEFSTLKVRYRCMYLLELVSGRVEDL